MSEKYKNRTTAPTCTLLLTTPSTLFCIKTTNLQQEREDLLQYDPKILCIRSERILLALFSDVQNRKIQSGSVLDSNYVNTSLEKDGNISDHIYSTLPETQIRVEQPGKQFVAMEDISNVYEFMWLEEWLYFTRTILFNRLASGFGKFDIIELPSCPYILVKKFLLLQKCRTYCRTYKRKSDKTQHKRRCFVLMFLLI